MLAIARQRTVLSRPLHIPGAREGAPGKPVRVRRAPATVLRTKGLPTSHLDTGEAEDLKPYQKRIRL
jgi:hypothetical protein